MLSPANEQVKAGQIAREAIALATKLCIGGLDGMRLDKEVEEFIKDQGGRPALKGYHPHFAPHPYKWTICLGIDNDVVHGVPIKMVGPSRLISVDLVVEYNGWFADTARTFTVSDDVVKQKFAKGSRDIFHAALEMILPQQSINLFGMMVESAAHLHGYSVIQEYCGHGIGKSIHAEPQVCNYPTSTQEVFQVGRSYAVEPVLAINPTYSLRHEPQDGFSVRADCLASHNEDTIFVGQNGIVNLTGNES